MTTIVPHSENLRKAILWIGEQRREFPDELLVKVLDEAGRKFDLTPAQSEALFDMLTTPTP